MGTYPNVTLRTYETADIDDYFDDACHIWNRDKSERSIFDLWFHVMDHCARLVEAVRKESPADVIDDLADTFMWLMSFIAQTHQSANSIDELFNTQTRPSDILWNKYPGICPACLDYEFLRLLDIKENENPLDVVENKGDLVMAWIEQNSEKLCREKTPCTCLIRVSFTEERHKKNKEINHYLDQYRLHFANLTREKYKVRGIQNHEKMFESLYSHAYQVYSLQTIAFHLLEEVGEVTQALKDCYTFDTDREPFSEALFQRRKLKLEEEIADVISWIFALILKIRRVYFRDAYEYLQTILMSNKMVQVLIKDPVTLPNIIWAKYGHDQHKTELPNLICSGCFNAPCNCKRDLRIYWDERKHP